jgi:hypothetical protein
MIFRVGKKKFCHVDIIELLASGTDFTRTQLKRILKDKGIDIYLVRKIEQ